MLRIDVRRARPGMKLALPVYNPKAPARVLLKLGYELTNEIIHRLVDAGVGSLWVQYPSLEFLSRFMDAPTLQVQQSVVTAITDTFETLQSKSAAKLHYETYTETITALVEHLVAQPNAAMFLGDLFNADDDLLRHSAAVTYVSVLIGMKLEGYIVRERKHVDPMRAKEIVNLGIGAMLHDLGVLELPEEVRERYEQTGDDSDTQWREHPALGFRLVRGRVEPSAATVVLNHHQRFDGSGYCGAEFPVLEGKSIHIFARIAAMADAFDRLRVPKASNGAARPTVAVLHDLYNSPLGGGFDPHILQTLVAVVPPYPPGSVLRLSDGRWAVAIDHNLDDPCRPQVQIINSPEDWPQQEDAAPGEQVHLGLAPAKLCVVECDGQAVEEWNFRPPHVAEMSMAASW